MPISECISYSVEAALRMERELLRAHSLEGTIEESSQDKKKDCDDTKQHHDPTGE